MSKQDLLRALGSPEFMSGELIASQPDETDRKPGDPSTYQEDDLNELFKKTKHVKDMGILKVKFLGNALKDYQLIRPADEVPCVLSEGQSTTAANTANKIKNQPSAIFLQKAIAALSVPCLQVLQFHKCMILFQLFPFLSDNTKELLAQGDLLKSRNFVFLRRQVS